MALARVDLPLLALPKINIWSGYFLARLMTSSLKGLALSFGSDYSADRFLFIIWLMFLSSSRTTLRPALRSLIFCCNLFSSRKSFLLSFTLSESRRNSSSKSLTSFFMVSFPVISSNCSFLLFIVYLFFCSIQIWNNILL